VEPGAIAPQQSLPDGYLSSSHVGGAGHPSQRRATPNGRCRRHIGGHWIHSFFGGRAGRLLGVVLAAAVLVAVVRATDHPLSSIDDELIGARMTAAVGAIGCAFAGMVGAYVLWDLERHRFPRRVTAYIRLQHASIVMCTIGLGLALLTAITVFGGLLLALLTGLGAAVVGAVYILASVTSPFGGFESNDQPDPDANWLWAKRHGFVQVVQVIVFALVHLFMVVVTTGVWLLPPALAIAVRELVQRARRDRVAETSGGMGAELAMPTLVGASLPLAASPPVRPEQ
jgi:hypothetical protein